MNRPRLISIILAICLVTILPRWVMPDRMPTAAGIVDTVNLAVIGTPMPPLLRTVEDDGQIKDSTHGGLFRLPENP